MGFFALSILPAMPASAETTQQKCEWFRAEPVAGPWRVIQGSCKIIMTGSHFDAELFDDKSPTWTRMKLSGSIQDGKVAAKVELQGTDAGIEDFAGDVKTNALLGTILVMRDGPTTIGIKFGPN